MWVQDDGSPSTGVAAPRDSVTTGLRGRVGGWRAAEEPGCSGARLLLAPLAEQGLSKIPKCRCRLQGESCRDSK